MNTLTKESPMQRIIRKTGRKPIQCRCKAFNHKHYRYPSVRTC